MRIQYLLLSVVLVFGFERSVFALQVDITKLSSHPLLASGFSLPTVNLGELTEEEVEQENLNRHATTWEKHPPEAEAVKLVYLSAQAHCQKFGLNVVGFQLGGIPQAAVELETVNITKRNIATPGQPGGRVSYKVDLPENFPLQLLRRTPGMFTMDKAQIFSQLNCEGSDEAVVQAVLENADITAMMAALVGRGQLEFPSSGTHQQRDNLVFSQLVQAIATNPDKALGLKSGTVSWDNDNYSASSAK